MSKLAEFLAPYIERVESKNIIGEVLSNRIKKPFELVAFNSQEISFELTEVWYTIPETKMELGLYTNLPFDFSDIESLDDKYLRYYDHGEIRKIEYTSPKCEVDTFAIIDCYRTYAHRVVAYYNASGLIMPDIIGMAYCG